MTNYRKPKRKYLIDIRITAGLNLTIDQKKIKRRLKRIANFLILIRQILHQELLKEIKPLF